MHTGTYTMHFNKCIGAHVKSYNKTVFLQKPALTLTLTGVCLF